MAKKSIKDSGTPNTDTPIDRQVFRISQFRHRISPPRSTESARPYDYLSDREIALLNAVFSKFGLDIDDPAQRDYLLALLIYGIFGDEGERSAGRPPGAKTWNRAAKLVLINQVNDAITAIRKETGAFPKTYWTITEKISPNRSRRENTHLNNRIRELYKLQRNKKK